MSSSESEASGSKQDHMEALSVELTCPICLKLFSEPASLPCGHIYCLHCLHTMGEGVDQYTCPECQTQYNGTEALVKNVKMFNIVETYKATAGRASAASDSSAGDHATEDGLKCLQEAEAGNIQGSLGKSSSQISAGSSGGANLLKGELDKSQDEAEMKEPKLQLVSQLSELSLKLDAAEGFLKKVENREREAAAANSQLRERASTLLRQMKESLQSYSARVMQLIEDELSPGEDEICRRVSQASELSSQLRQAVASAESLLKEESASEFNHKLRILQPIIAEQLIKPVGEDQDHDESLSNPAQACPKLKTLNSDLRERFGEIQRSLRNTVNPSEVTFDPYTLHPNLLLSEDLKTVTFSAAKQPYPPSPQRFTSFFQVLSSQSFSEGEHSWEVEFEGSPWIIGVCHSTKLERIGMASALESSHSSWCLMWHNNLLTAFEQSRSVPLKRTTVSRRLEIRLNFKTHKLSFYNVSQASGKTHVYTFEADLSEPVHLAYRMMTGHPKGRATVY